MIYKLLNIGYHDPKTTEEEKRELEEDMMVWLEEWEGPLPFYCPGCKNVCVRFENENDY